MPRNIPAAKVAEIDQYLESECKNYQIPGLSAVIVDGQEILWMKAWGFANLELKIPATVDTRYRICSVTKLFTATMLMQLCEQNRLHLDESVAQYIPEFSRLQQSVPITFRHLVSHTSGLPMMPPNIQKFVPKPIHEFTHEDYCKLLYPAVADVIAGLNETKLLCQPGAQLHYSNFGIALMAYALEKIARQDYETYIIEQILQPLAMHGATFDVRGGMSEDVALGYYAWHEKRQQALPYHHMAAFTPTGGLYSSAHDIAHFLILHLDKVRNGKNTVLTQQSIQQMRQPILKTEKSRYISGVSNGGVGIGWFLSSIANTPVLEHGGGDFPFTTFLLLAPVLDLGVFVATNTGSYPSVRYPTPQEGKEDKRKATAVVISSKTRRKGEYHERQSPPLSCRKNETESRTPRAVGGKLGLDDEFESTGKCHCESKRSDTKRHCRRDAVVGTRDESVSTTTAVVDE